MVERYVFDLYVNGQRVGTSFSTYRGTDPSVDPQIYSEAAAINQILDSGGSLDLEFTLYIYSAQMEIIRRAQGSGPMSWHVRSKFTTFLPYSHEKDFIFLTAAPGRKCRSIDFCEFPSLIPAFPPLTYIAQRSLL